MSEGAREGKRSGSHHRGSTAVSRAEHPSCHSLTRAGSPQAVHTSPEGPIGSAAFDGHRKCAEQVLKAATKSVRRLHMPGTSPGKSGQGAISES
jgi:hypothetical protein